MIRVKITDTVCPICGGPMCYPRTGLVTNDMLEDYNKCNIIQIVDEYNNPEGYTVCCKHKGEI